MTAFQKAARRAPTRRAKPPRPRPVPRPAGLDRDPLAGEDIAMPVAPYVLIAPASGPGVGGGHVMRQLALAEALALRGAAVGFAVGPVGADLLARLAPDGAFEVFGLERSGDVAAVAALARAQDATAVVLDDYGLNAAAVAPLAAQRRRIAVVDDLADRAYACDLLIDPGYGHTAEDYADRVPAACRVLAGPAFALLRRSFAERAAAARSVSGDVKGVFVSFGLADPGGVAARAVEALRPVAPDARFDVALGRDASSLAGLRRRSLGDANLRLHPDARDMASLIAAADVGVGAGGASVWERAALGLPSVALIVAENQRRTATALAAAGATLVVDQCSAGWETRLADAFARLLDPGVRARLAEAGRALCDGQGAGRAADAVLAI